jgi:hypothetical protein
MIKAALLFCILSPSVFAATFTLLEDLPIYTQSSRKKTVAAKSADGNPIIIPKGTKLYFSPKSLDHSKTFSGTEYISTPNIIEGGNPKLQQSLDALSYVWVQKTTLESAVKVEELDEQETHVSLPLKIVRKVKDILTPDRNKLDEKSDKELVQELNETLTQAQTPQELTTGLTPVTGNGGNFPGGNCHSQPVQQVQNGESLMAAYQRAYEIFKRDDINKKLLNSKSTAAMIKLKDNFISQMWHLMSFKNPDGTENHKYFDQLILALTGVGEAGGSGRSDDDNRAEMTAVMKVIQNRAVTNYRTDPASLKQLGIPILSDTDNAPQSSRWDSSKDNRRARAALAKIQFSPWTPSDGGFKRMVMLDPNQSSRSQQEQLSRAFEMVEELDNGNVDFSTDDLGNVRTRHFLANNAHAKWERSSLKIAPKVQLPGHSDWTRVTTQKFYKGVH